MNEQMAGATLGCGAQVHVGADAVPGLARQLIHTVFLRVHAGMPVAS